MSGSPPARLNVRVFKEVIWVKGRIVGSMLAWLAAVATVAGIATIAIGTAGRQVRPQLLASSSPLAVPEAVQSTPVTDGGASGYGEASSGGSGADTPASAGQSGGGATPVLRERAVRAAGGHVQARCTGRRVAGYALPDDGWQARISATAQRRLEVVFSFGAERAVLVTAVCEADGPTFRQTDLDPRGPVRTVPGPGSGQPAPTVTQISPTPAPSTGTPVPTKPGKPTPSGTTTAPTPTSGLPSSSVPPSSPPASTATSTATSSATASAVEAPEESPSPSGATADRSRSGSSDPVEASPTAPAQCTPGPADPSVPLPSATPSDTVGAAPGPEEGAGCATTEPGGPTLGM
jgi:hypothetical protein